MARRQPDRALRRAVADLARLHPDDAAAILGALEPGEKARIDTLVQAFSGRPTAVDVPKAEPVWTYEGVSPWLLARLEPEAKLGSRQSRDVRPMTDAARDALCAAAEPVRRQVRGAERKGDGTLLGQAWRALVGARG